MDIRRRLWELKNLRGKLIDAMRRGPQQPELIAELENIDKEIKLLETYYFYRNFYPSEEASYKDLFPEEGKPKKWEPGLLHRLWSWVTGKEEWTAKSPMEQAIERQWVKAKEEYRSGVNLSKAYPPGIQRARGTARQLKAVGRGGATLTAAAERFGRDFFKVKIKGKTIPIAIFWLAAALLIYFKLPWLGAASFLYGFYITIPGESEMLEKARERAYEEKFKAMKKAKKEVEEEPKEEEEPQYEKGKKPKDENIGYA